jgi:hypothetical protein
MKVVFLFVVLVVFSFDLNAKEFDLSQFNKMVSLIGKDARKTDYQFKEEKDTKDVFYRYFNQKHKGGFLGIGSYAVSETFWADSWHDVFAALWVMDGNSKQENKEYRRIVSILSNELGKPATSTTESTTWKWKKLLVSVALPGNYVEIKIVAEKRKTWVQTWLGWLFDK